MKVRDILRGQRLFSVKEEDPIELAVQIMAWGGIRHLPVLRDGRLAGLLSERDVLRSRGGGAHARRRPVREAMSAPVKIAAVDDDLSALEARFVQEKIGCLPIVEKGRLLGMVTPADLLAEQLRRNDETSPTGERVRDAMTADPLTASEDDLLLDAAGRMAGRGIRHLPVVDGDRRLLGMLSDTEVRTAVGDPRRALDDEERAGRSISDLRVADAMSVGALAIQADALLSRAVDLLVASRRGALPAIDGDGRLVGILSYLDVLRRTRRA